MKTEKLSFLLFAAFLIVISSNNHVSAQDDFKNPLAGNLEAGSVKGAFYLSGNEVWGSSVIQHEDGKYYMFASAWPAASGHWIWATSSQIVIATSDTPEGPYEFKKTAIAFRDKKYWDGGSIYNPVIKKHKDTYYLFYTGTTYGFKRPKNETLYNRNDERFYIAWENQRIGVATSKHPMGPWKRYDKPIISPREEQWDQVMTTNAAPIIHEDGSVTLFYKSSNLPMPERFKKDKNGNYIRKNNLPRFIIGVAKADHIFGEYRRTGENEGTINIEGKLVDLEDPFAWYDGTNYHMIIKNFDKEFSDEAGAALYLRSKDGVSWQLPSNDPKAYSQKITWKEGMTFELHRLEKPSILFENGKPAWLFAAAYFGKKNEKYCATPSCVYNIVFKIKKE